MVSLLTASEEEPGATIPLAFPTALWRAIRAVFLVALLVLFPVVRRTVPRALAKVMWVGVGMRALIGMPRARLVARLTAPRALAGTMRARTGMLLVPVGRRRGWRWRRLVRRRG
ncbi:hypothetical protein [Microbispora sp. H10949]|uniref:hypothetical protein n=1 Tax=Microbispora sp. H10949 TaxID=2729111 RepID=UPI0015FF1143|nr:hypothetical protein [Microbispora sp. H10949]